MFDVCTNGVIATTKLAKAVYNFAMVFDGAKKLKKRYRSLELVIVNGLTNHSLKYSGFHFDSGNFFSHPTSRVIEPQSFTIATVANKQGSVLCGVAGGMAFKISGTSLYFIIGFTHPALGSIKSVVDIDQIGKAKSGYNQTDNGDRKYVKKHGCIMEAWLEESDISDRRIVFYIYEKNRKQTEGRDNTHYYQQNPYQQHQNYSYQTSHEQQNRNNQARYEQYQDSNIYEQARARHAQRELEKAHRERERQENIRRERQQDDQRRNGEQNNRHYQTRYGQYQSGIDEEEKARERRERTRFSYNMNSESHQDDHRRKRRRNDHHNHRRYDNSSHYY